MSFRKGTVLGHEMSEALRDIFDRLERIEGGGALRGQVSFDSVILVGEVRIAVTNGVGNQRILTFANVLTGASSTIIL